MKSFIKDTKVFCDPMGEKLSVNDTELIPVVHPQLCMVEDFYEADHNLHEDSREDTKEAYKHNEKISIEDIVGWVDNRSTKHNNI